MVILFLLSGQKNIVLFLETGRMKSFSKVTRPQTRVLFFLTIQWKARSNKLHRHRATYVKSTNSKKITNNECLQFVYIHFTFRFNEATYVFTFQIKVYTRCSLIINACLYFAINTSVCNAHSIGDYNSCNNILRSVL